MTIVLMGNAKKCHVLNPERMITEGDNVKRGCV